MAECLVLSNKTERLGYAHRTPMTHARKRYPVTYPRW